ncbi:MFS transporter [Clostridium sp. AM58-1XD]|uniref:MFS transporter n=1 Tax=Clostridium sp. AM58-1XD TaxID=2292307 RepID=UPI000E541A2B|nr:MFS transporter [Clostridium sp. AM58-1XD]RGZ01783.1 MFS transporter [Clostridium sp. AM58-1XD]
MNEQKNWKRQAALFLISQNLSIFGSSVVGFSIIWYITLKTSSGIWITAATIATLLPQVIVSLWAGVVADRYDRKWIIMISDSFTAVATLAAFLAFQAGKESVAFLIVVSFLRSMGGGFQAPAVNALYPQIIPESHLVRINGINQTANNILLLISPAVGGLILGTMGIKWTFLVDVTTAAAAVMIMSRMKMEEKKAADREKSTVMQELKGGISYTWRHPFLRVLMICYAVTFILITPASFLSPLMVSRTFGEEVWRLTANEMFWTAGSIAGGIMIAWKGDFNNKITAIAVSLSGFGITFALMGFTGQFWLYLMLDCICGIFLPFLITAQTVVIQKHTDMDYMGRVFSLLQFVSQGVMPVAILGFGPLGDMVKIQTIIIVCGILLAAWGVWFKFAAEKAVNKG